MKKTFTEETKHKIYEMYKHEIGTVKISKEIHTSPKKIREVLLEFGIDIHDPNKPIGKKVMPIGFWEIKENNEKAASKCKKRREFSQKFYGAYKAAKKHGWLREYDEKYFNSEINFVSFDDPVHVIYVYEVVEKHSVYVGRTIDLKRRDLCHRNKTQNDTLFRYCQDNKVSIPNVKVVEEKLTAIQSQEKEDYWKNKYKDDGWEIINKATTGVGSGSLGSIPRKWNYETCKEVAGLCISKEDFKKRYVGAHNVARRNGWIYDFFPNNMKKENGCFDTFEKCKETAMQYDSIMQIRREYPFLYRKISKNKWTGQIRELLKNRESNI